MTFLFWNTYRKDLSIHVERLVRKCGADVVILVESVSDIKSLIKRLNVAGDRFSAIAGPGLRMGGRFTILSRYPEIAIQPVFDGDGSRLSMWRFSMDGKSNFLFGVVHLESKLRATEDDQFAESVRYSARIKSIEEDEGHQRTVIIGDFNMNPFEKGMASASGFNAVMERKTAGRGSRTVQGTQYPFFYNPMWNRFGDEGEGPPGSHFYNSSGHVNYFWNIFDQVLIRPEMLNFFSNNDLDLVTFDGDESLVDKNGRPNSRDASDHLPLTFKLSI